MISTKQTGYPSIDKPWLKYYNEDVINGSYKELSIYDYLYENNKNYLSQTSLHYLGNDISYGDVFKKIKESAAALQAYGCKRGDIVTIALPCMPEAVYLVFACSYIGAVANMIHPLAGADEINRYLVEVKSKIFIMFTGTYEIVKGKLDRTYLEHAVVVSPLYSAGKMLKILSYLKKDRLDSDYISWSQFVKNAGAEAVKCDEVGVDDVVVISHTGGTTGEPKGVMLTSRNYVSIAWQMAKTTEYTDFRKSSLITVLPPFVNYSLTNNILEPCLFGIKVVLIPNYEADKLTKYIRKYKPQHIMSIPPYWEKLLDSPTAEKLDFSCLENIYYGGEAMEQDKKDAVDEVIKKGKGKVSLLCGFGMTELTSVATLCYPHCNYRGSSGIPIARLNCSIVNVDTNEELTYGNQGEVCFSGDTLMLGYYQNEAATNEMIKVHSDGNRWLHTGDIGYITEDGVLYITGRMKRLIITKDTQGMATKIFPDRVENVIAGCEGVKENCVVEKADDERVNVLVAYVCLNDGCSFDEIKKSVMQRCKKELPEYMVPVDIVMIDDMPRTSRGKIDYRKLQE